MFNLKKALAVFGVEQIAEHEVLPSFSKNADGRALIRNLSPVILMREFRMR